MATTIDYPLPKPAPSPAEFSFSQALWKWVATVDHKRLGILYIATALIFFLISGLMALTIRWQLIFPLNHLVEPDTYDRLFTMHGTTMVFFVGMPIVATFKLPHSVDDRRTRYGFPAAECLRLLDLLVWGLSPLFQLYRWQRLAGRGLSA